MEQYTAWRDTVPVLFLGWFLENCRQPGGLVGVMNWTGMGGMRGNAVLELFKKVTLVWGIISATRTKRLQIDRRSTIDSHSTLLITQTTLGSRFRFRVRKTIQVDSRFG